MNQGGSFLRYLIAMVSGRFPWHSSALKDLFPKPTRRPPAKQIKHAFSSSPRVQPLRGHSRCCWRLCNQCSHQHVLLLLVTTAAWDCDGDSWTWTTPSAGEVETTTRTMYMLCVLWSYNECDKGWLIYLRCNYNTAIVVGGLSVTLDWTRIYVGARSVSSPRTQNDLRMVSTNPWKRAVFLPQAPLCTISLAHESQYVILRRTTLLPLSPSIPRYQHLSLPHTFPSPSTQTTENVFWAPIYPDTSNSESPNALALKLHLIIRSTLNTNHASTLLDESPPEFVPTHQLQAHPTSQVPNIRTLRRSALHFHLHLPPLQDVGIQVAFHSLLCRCDIRCIHPHPPPRCAWRMASPSQTLQQTVKLRTLTHAAIPRQASDSQMWKRKTMGGRLWMWRECIRLLGC